MTMLWVMVFLAGVFWWARDRRRASNRAERTDSFALGGNEGLPSDFGVDYNHHHHHPHHGHDHGSDSGSHGDFGDSGGGDSGGGDGGGGGE